MDLTWDPNLAIEESNEYKNLVEEFDDKVGFNNCFLCLL